LIGAGGVEAIEGEVGRLANTHASVPEQQQDVSAQIVAAQQFLLEELILLRGEGTGQASRGAGNILATEELGELGKLRARSQFGENAAEEYESTDVSDRRERGNPGVQLGHPAEDVWIAAQLIERDNLGMVGAEIGEKVAGRAMVEASRLGG
jgi:hypothetical protein